MRITTGISGFDDLIEGGLVKSHVYILSGPPGSGRTTFGIQFLIEGAMQNESGLFLSLTETPTNVIKNMSRFKFDLVKHIKAKKIFFMDGTQELFGDAKPKGRPEQTEIFDLAAGPKTSKDLFEKIEPILAKAGIQRLVIDSTLALSFLTKSREDGSKQMAKYVNLLKQNTATVLLLSEVIEPNAVKFEHYLSHGIFYLHHFPNSARAESSRAIQILKMRGTKHDSALHPIIFSDNGLELIEPEIPIDLPSSDAIPAPASDLKQETESEAEPEFTIEED
jgi:KaiC/GvpD/RAD55 family RecA-like ATPase